MLDIFTVKQWMLVEGVAQFGYILYFYKKLRQDNIDLAAIIKRQLGPK